MNLFVSQTSEMKERIQVQKALVRNLVIKQLYSHLYLFSHTFQEVCGKVPLQVWQAERTEDIHSLLL